MNKLAQRLLFTLIVLGFSNSFAQNITKSPYSLIGIGDIHFLGTSQQQSMGQIGQGIRKSAEINALNPASFSGLKYTVIDGALFYSTGKLEKGKFSSDVDNASFSYFMFGIPLHTRLGWGLVFGLTPYSAIGYNVASVNQYNDFVATTQVIGSGGLSRFHLGSGIKLAKNLSLGVNMSYLFGQTTVLQNFIVPQQYNKMNLAESRNRIINGVQWQVGTQYHKDFELGTRKDKYTFVAGATYTANAKLSAREEYFMRSTGIGQTTGVLDTIQYNESNKGFIELPYALSGGLSFEKKEKWFLGSDLTFTNWTSYNAFGFNDSLKNSMSISIGGSFIPKATDYKHYYNRIEYRLGVKYDNGNVFLAGKKIATRGVAAGFGLPLGKSKTRLNLSIEYYVRGTLENSLIREDYFRFTLGVNFSDKWFQRYKYD